MESLEGGQRNRPHWLLRDIKFSRVLNGRAAISVDGPVRKNEIDCNINLKSRYLIDIPVMSVKPFPLLPSQALAGLGQRVALARRARQLNQRDLAFLAGVGASSIVALEKGHPGVAMGTLVRVLDALGLLAEMDQLLAPQRDPALVQHAVRTLQK